VKQGHAIAFMECPKTFGVDTRMMNEHIGSVFLLNETVAFFLVKPFNGAVGHSGVLLS